MFSMIAVAAPLIIIAIVCWFIAGRIDLKRKIKIKIKSWSGERTTTDEVQSARVQILSLRIVASVCVVLAVLGAAGINLMSAYHAYGVK